MFVFGRNPVVELISSSPDKIIKILVAENCSGEIIDKIINIARKKSLKIELTNKHKLDSITGRGVHQGILAFIREEMQTHDLESILKIPVEKNEKAFFVILDSIFDPQNLGNIIRTAETAGVHGIIIPKHRSCRITPTVVKVSAGATQYIHVVEVVNIVNTIMILKERGIVVLGTDNTARDEYLNVDMNKDIAIVIGNEETGIRRLTKENCDLLVKVPMKGKISSLNISVAAAILIFEVLRQRKNFS